LSLSWSPLLAPNLSSAQQLKFDFALDIGGEPSFAITQDRDGFLWFGSFFNGLVRYDGTNVKLFKEGPGSISSDFVTQIFEDRNGIIWAGTNSDLNRYDKQTNSFKHFFKDPENTNSLTSNDIYTVFEDRFGYIWVGTKHHGATRIDPEKNEFVQYRHDPTDPTSIPDDEIQAILEDAQGSLWFGSRDNGLIRLDRETNAFEPLSTRARRQHEPAPDEHLRPISRQRGQDHSHTLDFFVGADPFRPSNQYL
jgi:ligand-binding sensor domain-containing protein